MQEAGRIYEDLQRTDESGKARSSQTQWSRDETLLLQFQIFQMIFDRKRHPEDFTDSEWNAISQLVPHRTVH
jgi:hypothetical protein